MVLCFGILKRFFNSGSHWNGLGIGEGTVITTRAANHIGCKTTIGAIEIVFAQSLVELWQFGLLDISQNKVLLMGYTGFTKAIAVCEIGKGFEVAIGYVPWRDARPLQ